MRLPLGHEQNFRPLIRTPHAKKIPKAPCSPELRWFEAQLRPVPNAAAHQAPQGEFLVPVPRT